MSEHKLDPEFRRHGIKNTVEGSRFAVIYNLHGQTGQKFKTRSGDVYEVTATGAYKKLWDAAKNE